MDLLNPPERYWHCGVKLPGQKHMVAANDLTWADLKRLIVEPWLAGRRFSVAGSIVDPTGEIEQIRISHTREPLEAFSGRHYERMRAQGISDFVTIPSLIPLRQGEDVTNDLLFASKGGDEAESQNDSDLVMRVCERLPRTAGILAHRGRGKDPFRVEDEYDVQDLLHAVLRSHLKYSVQEDPLGKVAGAKAGRADISIESLGLLVEVKYARGAADHKRIVEEFSEDLILYTNWKPLKTLIFLVYNSGKLRDPEALEELGGIRTMSGVTFDTKIILA